MTHIIEKNFDKAANTYDDNAVIQVKSGELLFNALEHTLKREETFTEKTLIDLGAGTGRFSKKLLDTFPHAKICAFDLSHRMMLASKRKTSQIYCIQGHFDQMPFKPDSVDLIFSNFALQWSLNLAQTFSEIHRILKNKSHFLFSIPGPSTLHELKKSFAQIDHYTHVNHFYGINKIIEFLQQQNLTPIHTQTQHLTLHFKDIFSLLKHLKLSGANSVIKHQANTQIQPTLMTQKKMEALSNVYRSLFQEGGLMPATYESFIFIVQKRSP